MNKRKVQDFEACMIGYAAAWTACLIACDLVARASMGFFLDLAPHLCAGFLCLGLLLGRECEGISMDRCIECPLLCMCQGLVQISPRVLFAKAWLYDNGKSKEEMA